MKKLKIKQISSGNSPYGYVAISDGSGNTFFEDISNKGVLFPTSPDNGDLYFRTDVDLLFYYDQGRSKWLTINSHTYNCGRNSLPGNVGGYFGISDVIFNSTTGFIMPRNGTIISVSFTNDNTITRLIDFRVNNSTSNRYRLSLNNESSNFNLNVNLNFSQGDIIQVGSVSSIGNDIDNGIATFNVAWRV